MAEGVAFRAVVASSSQVAHNIIKLNLVESEFEVLGPYIRGRDLLKLYAQIRPDLVLLDLELLDMPGVDLLDQLMALKTELPPEVQVRVVVVTMARVKSKAIAQCLQNGARAFIQPPFDRAGLLEPLREALED